MIHYSLKPSNKTNTNVFNILVDVRQGVFYFFLLFITSMTDLVWPFDLLWYICKIYRIFFLSFLRFACQQEMNVLRNIIKNIIQCINFSCLKMIIIVHCMFFGLFLFCFFVFKGGDFLASLSFIILRHTCYLNWSTFLLLFVF